MDYVSVPGFESKKECTEKRLIICASAPSVFIQPGFDSSVRLYRGKGKSPKKVFKNQISYGNANANSLGQGKIVVPGILNKIIAFLVQSQVTTEFTIFNQDDNYSVAFTKYFQVPKIIGLC